MLVIRLLRTGKKNQPFFQVVVTDKRKPPRGGRFVEKIGFWNPLTKEKEVNVERVKYWLSKGAQPSATIHNFLIEKKIIEGKKIIKHRAKKEKKGDAEAKPETPTAEIQPSQAPEKIETPSVEAQASQESEKTDEQSAPDESKKDQAEIEESKESVPQAEVQEKPEAEQEKKPEESVESA